MTINQRARMLERFVAKWRDAPYRGTEEKLYRHIYMMLGYGASVWTINQHSRKYKQELGLCR